MTDLIERLRDRLPSISAMRDAADEIERLHRALATSIEQVKEVSAERSALRKRIAKAPVYFAGRLIELGVDVPQEWIGRKVRLVVENAE